MTTQGIITDLEAAMLRNPQRPYARFNDIAVTIGDVDRKSANLAAHLKARGVKLGDRVAIMMRNSPSLVISILAVARLGAVWVPINVHLVGEGLRYILEHSEPSAVLLDRVLEDNIIGCGLMTSGFTTIISGGTAEPEELEVLIEAERTFVPPQVKPSDLIAIMYTSGTTGRPKGVLVSHSMMRFSALGALTLSQAKDEDILFLWEPLYHIGGAQVLFLPFLVEISLAFAERFSASRFWSEVKNYGATHIHHMGGILQILLKQPPSDLDRNHGVRIAWGGACRKEIWQEFEQRFGVHINECYGMTECSSFTTANIDGVVGSVGPALPWFKIRLIDEQGQDVQVGQRGEIVAYALQDGCVTTGYFRNEEATRKALQDNAFYTGDVGSQDADGRYYFHGRTVDSLRYRGENVSAWEIEHIVNSHDDVEESAVIGVEAEIGEQDIKLFVQPRKGASVDPASLSDWLSTRLASFQRPRYIAFVEEFPKTPSQRIMKHTLPKSFHDSWDRQTSQSPQTRFHNN